MSIDASSFQDPNTPQNTHDNNLGTRWSAEGDGEWIRYDLGASNSVGRVEIAWYQNLANGQSWESVFDIEVSSDGVLWNTVFSGRSVAGNVQPESYSFTAVMGRYVRIVGHGQVGNPSSEWNSITEVDIYPAGAAPTAPEPDATDTIIIQDGFEDGFGAWREEPPNGRYSISDDPSRVHSGTQSLKVLFNSTNTWGVLTQWFMPGLDEVYVKFYVQYQENFDERYGEHFLTMCGNRTDTFNSCWSKSGIVPNGTDFWYAGVDPEFINGNAPLKPLHFYTYWPDMDTRDGTFGDRFFQTEPKTQLDGGQWQEVVFHIRMNTVGQSNGSQTLWLNGVKKIEKLNMRWRTTTALKINNIRFDNFMSPSPSPTQHKWIDDVIVWSPRP